MKTLKSIKEWYHSQCDGDWEHSYGVKIQNIDNPGWQVNIDFRDAELEHVDFPEVSYGVGEDSDTSGDEWMLCRRTEFEFDGCGGPFKLTEILDTFLEWAQTRQ